MGGHLLLWIRCSGSSNGSEFLSEHNNVNYGQRRVSHLADVRIWLFSFLERKKIATATRGERLGLRSKACSLLWLGSRGKCMRLVKVDEAEP